MYRREGYVWQEWPLYFRGRHRALYRLSGNLTGQRNAQDTPRGGLTAAAATEEAADARLLGAMLSNSELPDVIVRSAEVVLNYDRRH